MLCLMSENTSSAIKRECEVSMARLKTMAELKRIELQKMYDRAVEVRSSAYLWNNLPPEALHHLEQACEHLHLAVSHYDIEMNMFGRGDK